MIKTLKMGERVPDFPPKRYTKSQRYVKLRWKIGKREYLEVWEHQVVDGVVSSCITHHVDHNKHNNSEGNLKRCRDDADHSKEHRRLDHQEICKLYVVDGMSICRIAAKLHTDDGTITKILHKYNIEMRYGKGKPGNRRIELNPQFVAQALNLNHGNVSATAKQFGVSHCVIKRIAVRLGFRAPDNLFNRPSLVINA